MRFVKYILEHEMDKGVKQQDEKVWKQCADLSITWNCCAIGRKFIFNNENYDHWRVSQRPRTHGVYGSFDRRYSMWGPQTAHDSICCQNRLLYAVLRAI